MNYKFIIFALGSILFFAQSIHSQEEYIQVSGQVIDADSLKPIPFVHIVKKTNNIGVSTNYDGFFTIAIRKTDTLIISSMGFQNKEICFRDSNLTEKLSIHILLSMDTLILKPFTVYALSKYSQFKVDFVNLRLPKTYDREVVPVPGVPSYVGPPRPSMPSPVENPISYFYEKFSKSARLHRKLQKNRKRYSKNLTKIEDVE